MTGFEFNGKEYELKYSMKRIEMIESVTDMPTMAALQKYRGMLSLQPVSYTHLLKCYFQNMVRIQTLQGCVSMGSSRRVRWIV